MTTIPRADLGAISLRTDRLYDAAHHLRWHSALRFCTKFATCVAGGNETLYLETTRPPSWLSSGEQVLWQALGVLALREDGFVGGVIDLDAGSLDAGNRAALAEAVRMWEDAPVELTTPSEVCS